MTSSLFLGEIDELSPLGLSLFHLMIGLIFYFPLFVVDLALLPWSFLGVPWMFMADFSNSFDEVSWSFLMERLVPFLPLFQILFMKILMNRHTE